MESRKYYMNVRQICFFLIAFVPVVKVISLPAILARFSDEALWISLSINFIVDILIAMFIIYKSEQFKNMTFYEILASRLGKVITKIVLSLYALYFFIKGYIPIMEQRQFVEITLYETSPSFLTFLPYFFLCGYICTKGIKSIFRSGDIMCWFTIISLFTIVFISLSVGDYSDLLPITAIPASKILSGSFNTIPWFLDGSYFLFFMGKFKNTTHQKTKIAFSYIGVWLFMVLFMVVFYAIFGCVAQRQFFATIKMSKYNLALANVGRFDFLANFIFSASCVFAISLPLLFCTDCIGLLYNAKRRVFPAIIITLAMAIIVYTSNRYYHLIQSFIENYMYYYLFFMGIIMPFILVFCRRKKYEQIKK